MARTLGWVHQRRRWWRRQRSAAVASSFRHVKETLVFFSPRAQTSLFGLPKVDKVRKQFILSSNWYGNINAILNYTRADGTCYFGKGRGSTETPSKLFANHNALGQLTNHNTFRFSEGRPSSNPELIEPFVPGWRERYCNNLNYVKKLCVFRTTKHESMF